jgi:hypothetical protein
MRLESFKNYCPGCGEEVSLKKAPNGHFECPVCACEYKYDWRAWVAVGLPILALGVWVIGSLAGLWRARESLVMIGAAIVVVLLWYWGPQGYVIVHTGDAAGNDRNEKHIG